MPWWITSPSTRPEFFGQMWCVGTQYSSQRRQDLAVVATLLCQLVYPYHQGTDHGIPAQTIEVFGDFFDRFVQGALSVSRRGGVGNDVVALAVRIQGGELR